MQFLIPPCSAHSIPFGRRAVRLSVLPVIPESGAQLNRRTERPKGDEDDSLLVVAVPHGQDSRPQSRLAGQSFATAMFAFKIWGNGRQVHAT